MAVEVPAKLLQPKHGGLMTDRRAWTGLERCRRKLGLERLPLPIPVEEWIESPLGIRFGFDDLSHLGDNVLGAAFIKEREILIDERVLEHNGRFRFTCAHELGHMILHRSADKPFLERGLDVTFSTERYERQADRFAAAFLMPLPRLERTIIEALDERGLKRADCVYQLMHATAESEWLWRYRVLPKLTKTYGVSLSAAIYRCADLQTQISTPQQLLPRILIPRLMQRAVEGDEVTYVEVEDGIPKFRNLFSDVTSDDD